MSRATRRSWFPRRAMAAVVVLALTTGAVSACGGPDPAAEDPGETQLHMIENAGHRLAFHVTPGHGSTIVLDSGGGEDSSYWKDLVPDLHSATGATVITYDRAGLGKSDVVPGPWKVESAVSDLRSGLRRLGVTRNVILVSHSQAGEVATYFAKDNPSMVSGAVLVDANLPPFFTDEEIARLVAFARPQVDAAKKDPDKPRNRQLISTAESFVATNRAFHTVAWPDAVPATVIVSEKTPFDGSPEDARRWRAAAASFARSGPHRTLVTADNSSHDVPNDRPALVLEEIENMVTMRH
ncbi:alpha/beta fold hydrolase [Streptomyces sp. SID4982]|nr:alpha/beta fold hydrolase [Streptomyces sp. SID4982]